MIIHRSTQFVDLSNDLLLEIFDYLDVFDLYRSFAKLNQRFHSLITDSRISFQATFLHLTSAQLSFCEEILLPQIGNSLRFLQITGDFPFSKLSPLNSLQSIRLYDVSLEQFRRILRLTQCKSISIETKRIQNEKHLNELFREIFIEQKQLHSIECQFFTPLHFLEISNNPSELRRILLHHSCSSSDLIVLISQLKHLKHLTAQIDDSERELMDRDVQHLTSNLSIRSMIIFVENISFDRLKYFLGFAMNLRRLELICTFEFSFSYSEILEQIYPNIRFHFRYRWSL